MSTVPGSGKTLPILIRRWRTAVPGELPLAGQTVVVIGGGCGVGLEAARRARRDGAAVILTAPDPDQVFRVGRALGASIAAFESTDFDRLERFFGELSSPIDHVLATSPDTYDPPLADLDVEEALRDVEARLLLPLVVARLAMGRVRPGGSVLFLSGPEDRRKVGSLALDSALTAALPAMTRALAHELAPVRVNLIATGRVDRIVAPDDVAALAVQLMTSSAATGATFGIDEDEQLVES
jgi:NAD(P)-dependent dehydrogenase (short-subunit alcohol dehydrogenase family)